MAWGFRTLRFRSGTAARRPAASAATLALVLLVGQGASAGPPTDRLRDFFVEANRILNDPATEDEPRERLNAIRRMVSDIFDFRGAAQLALGSHWRARTSAEREEFIRLFTDLLERGYLSRVASRARVNGGVIIRYLDESIEGDLATVVTAVESRDGGEIPLEYRMVRRGARWAVRDVVIDGISVVDNYRAQFQRVLHGASYPELVAQMRAKTSRPPAAPSPPAASVATARPPVEPPAVAPNPGEAPGERRLDPSEHEVPKDASVVAGSRAGTERYQEAQTAAVPASNRHAPVAVTTTATSWWVQVGAFRNYDAASRLAARLLERRLPVSIGPVTTPADHRGESLLRVRVGPFSDRAAAASELRELRATGYKPFIAEGHD
ncbi:MAG: ABC transporter substrate-binding protein [Candidatus Rokubacteria bacterium]|nr:ABC transporter substrate-binding protein [Candidatus Rokubacteria bacterium]